MTSLVRSFDRRGLQITDNLFVEYILRKIIDYISSSLNQVSPETISIRSGYDEFSFYISSDTVHPIENILEEATRNVSKLVTAFGLDSIKHSKSDTKYGVYLNLSISQIVSSKILFKSKNVFPPKKSWELMSPDKYEIPVNLITESSKYLSTRLNLESELSKNAADIVLENIDHVRDINPSIIRVRSFKKSIKGKTKNSELLGRIYADIFERETPFEIIKDHVRYQRDLSLFLKLLDKKYVDSLNVHSISWLNWGGVVQQLGEAGHIK